jgi:hypothetical protein
MPMVNDHYERDWSNKIWLEKGGRCSNECLNFIILCFPVSFSFEFYSLYMWLAIKHIGQSTYGLD